MRIKDVREARQKAEKEQREHAEHEAKRQTERATRLECERLAMEARRNDAMVRDAKEKKEIEKQMKEEKAKMKARLEAQKVAQTVRNARDQAAKDENDELQRQDWVRREASAKKARLQAEKAEKKARAEAEQLQKQLKEAQEAVKRWECAEAQRRAREKRESQETSAQKQRVWAYMFHADINQLQHAFQWLYSLPSKYVSHMLCCAHIHACPTAFTLATRTASSRS